MNTSLYIHIPWCVRKCPYCDFNSHALKNELPESIYIEALLNDFKEVLPKIKNREIISIFIGGGTPSLFSPASINTLLVNIQQYVTFKNDIEITLEANPGTVEQKRFEGFYHAGINRLSIGIQSFQDDKLKTLGRIHNSEEAEKAVNAAYAAGFSNVNLDLMYALPQQSIEDALFDLKTAISLQPTHLSWYQLTLEPNTLFHYKPPAGLPNNDYLFEIEKKGLDYLANKNYQRYEISAYCKPQFQCKHNQNYWLFGDYLGIGAGAHSKITDTKTGTITRTWKTKNPKDYLDSNKPFTSGTKTLTQKEIPLEFMMNVLRLNQTITADLFEKQTKLPFRSIEATLEKISQKSLITLNEKNFQLTQKGQLFLNNVLAYFL